MKEDVNSQESQEKKENLNRLKTKLKDIMRKLGQSTQVIVLLVFLVVLFLLYSSSSIITIQREVIIVSVQDNSLSDVIVGFQKTAIQKTLFENIPKGNLRLYVEAKSDVSGETVYTYSNDNVGAGTFFLPNVMFPKSNDTLDMKFELKDTNLQVLDSKCFETKFIIIGDVKKIESNEEACT